MTEPHSPLFSKTYLIYRASPLFNIPPTPSPTTLRKFNKPLLDLLRGTSLRGVQLSTLEDDDLASPIGHLTSVTWSTAPLPRPLTSLDLDDTSRSPTPSPDQPEMITITLTYTSPPSTHTALFLPSSSTPTQSTTNSSSYPLLLLRIPASTRAPFLHYLTTTFDTFLAPYDLPSSTLCAMLETYLSHRTTLSETSLRHRGLYPPPPGKQGRRDERPASILAKGKEIVLTLDGGGTVVQDEVDLRPEAGREEEDEGEGGQVLASMSVTLPAGDLPRLYEGGTAIRELYDTYMTGVARYGEKKYLSMTSVKQGKSRGTDVDTVMSGTAEEEEGEDYQRLFPSIPKSRTGPLFLAVDAYLNSGMGLESFRLPVVKVACSGFVAGGRRVKIFVGGAEVVKVLVEGAGRRFGDVE